MKKINGGSVNKTYENNTEIIQLLNQNFHPYPIDFVNTTNSILREYGIVTATVSKQTKKIRIFNKLDGEFYDYLTLSQSLKAAKFLAKLHTALNIAKIEPPTNFYLVDEYSTSKNRILWGDLKTNNILWRKNEPVGIVDYDTISKGLLSFDVCTAMLMWQKEFSMLTAKKILEEYMCSIDMFDDMENYEICFKKFLLLKYKQFADEMTGLGYFKKLPFHFYKEKIKKLKKAYEESSNWRSV